MLWSVYRAWRRYPSLRFAQLVVNALPVGDPCPQVFYRKDEEVRDDMRCYRPQQAGIVTRFCMHGMHDECGGKATNGWMPDVPCCCHCHKEIDHDAG